MNSWAVVTVPFPYVERNAQKARPALVISTEEFQTASGLCWLLMVTTASNPGWPGDVPIDDTTEAGLTRPSVIRTAKVAVAEVHRLVPIGMLASRQRRRVIAAVAASLAGLPN